MARNDLRAKIILEAEDRASSSIDKVEGRFTRLGKSIKSNALAITAALAGVVVAFRQIEESAKQTGQEAAFFRNLGEGAQELLDQLIALSDGQIATNELILASNRALALGISKDDLPGLLQKATTASVDLGLSVTQAFNDITTGVGRASPLILDNLGIVVDSVSVYRDYAAAIGISAEALTKQQKTAALAAAVIGDAANATENFSTQQDAMTRAINKGRAAMDNLKSAAGTVLGGLVQMTAGGVVGATLGFSLLAEAGIKVLRGLTALGQYIPILGSKFDGLAEFLKNADDGIDGLQQRAAALALDLSKGGAAAVTFGLGITDLEVKAKRAAPALAAVAVETEKVGDEANDTERDIVTLDNSIGTFSETNRNRVVPSLEAVTAALAATGYQFDQLNEKMGRLAATEAALAAGGTLFGNRVLLSGGGSRFTTEPGFGSLTSNTSQLSGGTFQFTGKTVYQSPDGRIEVR